MRDAGRGTGRRRRARELLLRRRPERGAGRGVVTGWRDVVRRCWRGGRGAEQQSASSGTPLVLVAGSLTAFELSRRDSSWLVLEPDGTLRTESEGALVGFLHNEGQLERGDSLAGPGQMAIPLLHYNSWISQDVRVPIVQSDGAGGWVVSGHRRFEIEVTRESKLDRLSGLGKPKLHPRTGLPMVELASKQS